MFITTELKNSLTKTQRKKIIKLITDKEEALIKFGTNCKAERTETQNVNLLCSKLSISANCLCCEEMDEVKFQTILMSYLKPYQKAENFASLQLAAPFQLNDDNYSKIYIVNDQSLLDLLLSLVV